MEVDTPRQVDRPKRVIVDANNPDQEIPETKKLQVQQVLKKKKIISFIAKAHAQILLAFGLSEYEKDLSLGDQIHNVLFAAYKVLRQHHNQTNGTLASRIASIDYKVHHRAKEYTKQQAPIHKIVEDVARGEVIPFGHFSQNMKENWYGITGTLQKTRERPRGRNNSYIHEFPIDNKSSTSYAVD